MSRSVRCSSHLLRRFGPVVVLAVSTAVAPVHASDAKPPPVKIAVFDFELDDSSPSAVQLGKPETAASTMEKVSAAARDELAHSGRYVVIDAGKVAAKSVGQKTLTDCGGCEAAIAQRLGAQQSLIGLVRKVTQTDYYLMVRIRDARTGKVLDEEEANFAGDETGWASGARMLIRHQVLPAKELVKARRWTPRGVIINGGEFLMLALATCYCNDLYREAARLGVGVDFVEVEASAYFEGVGLAANNIRYRARVLSNASDAEVARLLRETDAVAEIHNTLRAGAAVVLEPWGGGSAP